MFYVSIYLVSFLSHTKFFLGVFLLKKFAALSAKPPIFFLIDSGI